MLYRKRVLGAAALMASSLTAFAALAEKPAENSPAMWKMTDEDSTVYLFGTFHILPPNVEWQTDAYAAAMAEAETTITEADTNSPEAQAALAQAVQQYGLNPPGTTLSSILGEERAAEFAKAADNLGVPMQVFEAQRPWLASLTLSVLALQKAGFDPNAGVEPLLLAQANAEGDKIDHFETGVEQIEILASLDEDEMLANFDASLDQFVEFETLMGNMLDAWRTGDVKGLEEDINGQLRDEAPDAFQKLLVDRNENWVVEIKNIMAGQGDYFIAVGAGHLVGEDSVIDMLNEEGFKVKRVQ
ncbi:MAG: TraB/GumN family protein [Pseudomonadota bacterium]